MKLSKNNKLFLTMVGIIFVLFNVILFTVFGFSDHEPTFWVSWAFAVIAFFAVLGVSFANGKNGSVLQDWLFGLPIIKYAVIYIALEWIGAILFIALEDKLAWQISFVVQLLLLGLFAVLIIFCFVAKNKIVAVEEKVQAQTQTIKLLRVDADMLCQKCGDEALKAKCVKLAEAIRYSDPVSAAALADLEQELVQTVKACTAAVTEQEYATAEQLCQKAMLLLEERNQKCKVLK